MRNKAPYRLFKRTVGGKIVWYYTAYDDHGKRYRFSTGCSSKTSALKVVADLHRDNSLIKTTIRKAVLFADYAKDWWLWDKCPYIKSQLNNGYSITPLYAHNSRKILTDKILPTFGGMGIHEITTGDIEDWLKAQMQDDVSDPKHPRKGVSTSTARNYLTVLSVMLDEAVRLGHMDKNPCKQVRTAAKRQSQRGVLSLAETKAIFADADEWYNANCYAANLLASVTGMRSGEVRALRCSDLHDDHIHVERSLGAYGYKSTKTGDVRDLPVPSKVLELLAAVKNDRFDMVFCQPEGKPYGADAFRYGLRLVLDKHGIDWKGRNIGFHSWRHFLNTQLLSHGISGEKTREITGHATEQMTQRYKHFQLEDYRDILDVTAQLLES